MITEKLILPVLEDECITLNPFDSEKDYIYLLNLIEKNKYTKITREEIKQAIFKYDTFCWNGYDSQFGYKLGVIYLTHIAEPFDFWSIDAYRDDELVKGLSNVMDYSLRAGRLVSDYALKNLTKTLYTVHYKVNRAATIACKKLGFKIEKEIDSKLGKFIMLKKEK